MTRALNLTHPADRTTVHKAGDSAPADSPPIERAIPVLFGEAMTYARGETAATDYLSRITRNLAQPGELAYRMGATDPGLCGFLARIERCLSAHLREGDA